jgi:hypothetical protein
LREITGHGRSTLEPSGVITSLWLETSGKCKCRRVERRTRGGGGAALLAFVPIRWAEWKPSGSRVESVLAAGWRTIHRWLLMSCSFWLRRLVCSRPPISGGGWNVEVGCQRQRFTTPPAAVCNKEIGNEMNGGGCRQVHVDLDGNGGRRLALINLRAGTIRLIMRGPSASTRHITLGRRYKRPAHLLLGPLVGPATRLDSTRWVEHFPR